METLLTCLDRWAKESPDSPAQAWKADGVQWKTLCARELRDKVEGTARWLKANGIGRGDVGLIYAYNSPAWVQMDLALMLVGAASSGLYLNASPRQMKYIVEHSEAKILFAESVAAARKFEPVPSRMRVVTAEVPTLAHGPTFAEMLAELSPGDRAALIYTSGTTGEPKAVSLSHLNLVFAAESYRSTWTPPPGGKIFSFLPLAHIAERCASTGMSLTNRYTVYFSSSPMTIASELKEIQPTILLCVPRLWDKLKEGAEGRIARLPDRRRRLLRWAAAVSQDWEGKTLSGRPVSLGLRLRHFVADRVVLKKIREGLGLTNAQRTVSGAAALSPATLEWYRGIGVRLIEGYALSESSGVLTCGIGDAETAFTVGIPYRGVELRIAADGEIETKGPHIFQGYFKDPAATAEVLRDGWLRTGDIGVIDERGYLKIAGRKREIIKNAEGKMISPAYLEGLLTECSAIEQAVVIGNERPHLVALLTLTEGARADDPAIATVIASHIARVNLDVASHERIKAYRALPKGFSIEHEEMTATLKLRRRVIEERYAKEIAELYAGPTASAAAALASKGPPSPRA